MEQNTTNDVTQKKEYDPHGLELGYSDPYLNNAEPDYASLGGGSFYRSGGNPFDSGGGCTIDRMAASCSEARFLLGAGIANQCPDNDCGPRVLTVTARGRDGQVIGTSSAIRVQGQAGWDGSLDGTWRVGAPQWSVGGINFNTSAGSGEFLSRLNYALHAPIDNPFKRISDDSPRYTQIASNGGGGLPGPQNTGQQFLNDGLGELKKRLQDPNRFDCAKLFGGLKKALKTLSQTKFSFGSLEGEAIAQIKGKNVTLDPSRFSESGATLAIAENIRVSTVGGHPSTTYNLKSITLTGVTFAAFALFHELGHRSKIYGEYDNDGHSIYSNLYDWHTKIWIMSFQAVWGKG